MSILSQAWQAERTKGGGRESWLLGSLSRPRYHQDSRAVLNDASDPTLNQLQSNPHRSDRLKNQISTLDNVMESPENRRRGQIFQKSPTCPETTKANYLVRKKSLSTSSREDHTSPESVKNQSLPSTLENVPASSPNSPPRNSCNSQVSRGQISRRVSSLITTQSLENSLESFSIGSVSEDSDKTTALAKSLSGRMRGEVEYQENDGFKNRGILYIDEINGSLMCEGQDGKPYPSTIITNLREFELRPIQVTTKALKSLELSNKTLEVSIILRPLVEADFDLWLAALSSWRYDESEFLSDDSNTMISHDPEKKRDQLRPKENKKCLNDVKVSSIIKVAKLLFWENTTSSTTQHHHKSSSKYSFLPSGSWRSVSCTLQDDGQFKLLAENDNTPLSVIQLSQLSRCSVQLIDRSVLGEEFCIAIFPLYAMDSSQLSFFNPVYIVSESRLVHEVWFCLLRAFTVPEIHNEKSFHSHDTRNDTSTMPERFMEDNLFRIEKSIKMRIIEAKFSNPPFDKPKTSHSLQAGKLIKDEIEKSIGDYYVEIKLDGEIRARTSIRTGTKNPFWGEDLEFQNLPPQPLNLLVTLKRVISTNLPNHSSQYHFKANTVVETASWVTVIPTDKLERGKDNENWWPILDQHQKKTGEIFLSINYDESVVLLTSDYQALSELLHNFSSGLTIQIAQFIPTKLKVLSKLMLNIFQVSGNAEDWITTLVEDEIDGLEKEFPTDYKIRWSKKPELEETNQLIINDREQSVRDIGRSLQEEANLLFRGNSLLTQALDLHMRRVGKEYLEEILLEKISNINLTNPDCEVDPSRISSNQDINKNWTLLYCLTTDIWNSIATSADKCPTELRLILKYVRAVAEDRYGNFLRTVVYTSVSGFLFLRFFCPALMNPKLFGLLMENPQPKAQRTLTLIAKSLQALANLSNFGKKEAWMEPMNRFLAGQRQSVKNFIDSICAISADQSISNLPASYSTPITIFGRLPPALREGFPSLPYLIDQAQSFAKLVKLWVTYVAKKEKLDGLHGELLEFHSLCLRLQYRADECLDKATKQNQKVFKQFNDGMDESIRKLDNDFFNSNPHAPKALPGEDSESTPSRSTRSSSVTMKVDKSSKHQGLKSLNQDHLLSMNRKSIRGHDQTDTNPTSPIRAPSREEWPLKSFLDGFRWRTKECSGSPHRDAEHDMT